MKRSTSQRLAIEKVFEENERPLGVDEILRYGREYVTSLNQATVYRNLKILMEEGRVKRVECPALGTFYERSNKEHHHHFYCRKCNKVFDMPGCVLKDDSFTDKGFLLEDHEVILYGVCSGCLAEGV